MFADTVVMESMLKEDMPTVGVGHFDDCLRYIAFCVTIEKNTKITFILDFRFTLLCCPNTKDEHDYFYSLILFM